MIPDLWGLPGKTHAYSDIRLWNGASSRREIPLLTINALCYRFINMSIPPRPPLPPPPLLSLFVFLLIFQFIRFILWVPSLTDWKRERDLKNQQFKKHWLWIRDPPYGPGEEWPSAVMGNERLDVLFIIRLITWLTGPHKCSMETLLFSSLETLLWISFLFSLQRLKIRCPEFLTRCSYINISLLFWSSMNHRSGELKYQLSERSGSFKKCLHWLTDVNKNVEKWENRRPGF